MNWDKKFCGRVDSEEDSFKSVGAQQVSRFIFTENNFGDGAPFVYGDPNLADVHLYPPTVAKFKYGPRIG